MASSARTFLPLTASGAWSPSRVKQFAIIAAAVCVAACVCVIAIGSLSPPIAGRSAQRIAELEQKIAELELRSTRTELSVSSHVQRALAEHMSALSRAHTHTITQANGQPAAAGGLASVMQYYPVVASLPSNLRKRILVTGGAGFVGSHLVDALMMQGHYVYVLDNLFTGRTGNIQHWLGHPHFTFFQADVVEPFMLEVDEIYHLACPASPPQYQVNPIKTIKTSTVGTMNMLGLAKRVRARLLFASTSEIYGDPEVHPQPETYWGNVNTLGPRSCYDEGKRVAETMCYSYAKEEGVEVRIARIFNTFGPRMHPNDGRVVSNFIIQALQGRPLTIYGEGGQTRSFQYVSDLVTGLIKLMNSDFSQPVNIGNPEEFTIKTFAEKIRALVNPNVALDFKPPTKDDPRKRQPDISRAKKYLGWQPQVSVDEGLYYTIQYFKEELNVALDAAAQKPKPEWTKRDEAPLWTSTVINKALTSRELGLVETGIYAQPKIPE